MSCFSIDTEFKVNKDKGTVTCIITTVDDVATRLAKYNLANEDYDYGIDIRKYVGVAYCSPEDIFDEAYGRRLAEYRASKARKIDVNNEITNFVKGIRQCANNLYKYGLLKEPHNPNDND